MVHILYPTFFAKYTRERKNSFIDSMMSENALFLKIVTKFKREYHVIPLASEIPASKGKDGRLVK